MIERIFLQCKDEKTGNMKKRQGNGVPNDGCFFYYYPHQKIEDVLMHAAMKISGDALEKRKNFICQQKRELFFTKK